nr:unnamed protein product [Callosobruchus chinensis]
MDCDQDDVCITYQYEITDLSSSNSYITTARGCGSNDTCPTIMNSITTKKEIQKGVLCHVCQEDLCNTSAKNKYIPHVLMVLLSYFTKYVQNI